MPWLFHVTPGENLDSILKHGLQPMIGPRAQQMGEAKPAIYLFTSSSALEDALMNWLAEAFEDDQQLALLGVQANELDGLSVTDGFECEATATSAIPSERLLVLTDNLDEINDLDALIREKVHELHFPDQENSAAEDA